MANNKGLRLPPEPLTRVEVEALLDACVGPMALRDRALICVMHRAELRVSETLSLYPKDIDLERGAVRVLNGKGGRSRTVGLDGVGRIAVSNWLESRAGVSPHAVVFCSIAGKPITPAHVRGLLVQLGRDAGIRKRVHPHGLRHTHATELREERFDIGLISKQLGHRSIATTAQYLDHIAPWAVVEAMSERG